MHSIKISLPKTWNNCNVYILADTHIGDPNCDVGVVMNWINKIAEDPNGVCILNGDLMNTATRGSISDVYGEVLTPTKQILSLCGILDPIRKKIIGVTAGNHEWRVYNEDGVDIMRLVCRELGCEERYHPDGVLIFTKFGDMGSHKHNKKACFVLYSTHGTGNGRKEGAKAIRMADMAAVVDADVYIHSHTHLPMVFSESYFRTDRQAGIAKPVTKWFVNTGAALNYGGYGQAKEFKPNALVTPVVHLNAEKARASVSFVYGDDE